VDPTDQGTWQFLADLLGPVGFVALLGAAAIAWMCWKREQAHRDERREWIDEHNKRLYDMVKQSREDRKDQFAVVNACKDSVEEMAGVIQRAGLKVRKRKR
jgi:hypothetical protein